MIEEAKAAGQYESDYVKALDRLQIVTVQEILDGKRIPLQINTEVAKKAQKSKIETGQISFLTDE